MTLAVQDVRLHVAERRTRLAYQAFWNNEPQQAAWHAEHALLAAADAAGDHQHDLYFGEDGPLLQRAEACIDALVLLQRTLETP